MDDESTASDSDPRAATGAGFAAVVVTGGPGSGKTTLVEALAARGWPTVPEAAIQVIDELNRRLGIDGQRAWRQEHRVEFQRRVLERQVALEEEVLKDRRGTAFLDRGRLDGVAYCRRFGLALPAELEAVARAGCYGRVLLLDTLASFEDRSSTGRTSDRGDSLAIRDALLGVYREAGFEPIRVPELSVPERVDFALAALARIPHQPSA